MGPAPVQYVTLGGPILPAGAIPISDENYYPD